MIKSWERCTVLRRTTADDAAVTTLDVRIDADGAICQDVPQRFVRVRRHTSSTLSTLDRLEALTFLLASARRRVVDLRSSSEHGEF